MAVPRSRILDLMKACIGSSLVQCIEPILSVAGPMSDLLNDLQPRRSEARKQDSTTAIKGPCVSIILSTESRHDTRPAEAIPRI